MRSDPHELFQAFSLYSTQRRDFGSLGGSGLSSILSDFLVPQKNQKPTEASAFPTAETHTPQLLGIPTLVSAQPEAAFASVKNLVLYLHLQSTFLIFMRPVNKS